jgi:hypothetical protein
VDFKEYVKDVLPKEWSPSWNIEALKAGAIAVKTFSWHHIINPRGLKNSAGESYHVRDSNCDQVYVPLSSIGNAKTNQAVDETWLRVMAQNGDIFLSQYDSGTPGQIDPLIPGRMSQNGTQVLASAPYNLDWQLIVRHYYDLVDFNSPCNLYTVGSDVPSSFGVPWNVFNTSELLLQAFCNPVPIPLAITFTADLGPSTYVYSQGYVWVNNNWQQTTFTCTGGQIVSGAWCPTSAQGQLPANSIYYVAYTCNWTGTKWNCGCRDTACTTSYWQIQGIQK